MKRHLLALLLISSSLSAQDNLQISGFGTIGTVSVDSFNYGYRSDISQDDGIFEDGINLTTTSILGLQLDYGLTSSLDLVYQAVYRDQNNFSLDSATSLAFIRYSPSASWSYRLGRTSIDLFLLSEYRDIGFAYPWAHTPSEVYGLVPYRNLDGLDVTYSAKLNDLSFRTKFYMGETQSDVSSYLSAETVELDELYGLSLDIESINWSLQARFTRASLVDDPQSSKDINNGLLLLAQNVPNFEFIWPDVEVFAQKMVLKNAGAEYLTFGGRYDLEQWTLMAEFSRTHSSSSVIPSLSGAYLSAIYNIGEHSFYVIYAQTESDSFEIDELGVSLQALSMISGGAEIYYGVDAKMNFYASNQNTASLGWRWNFSDNLALKAQWDYTKIEAKGGTLWLNKNFLNTPKDNVNSFFLNLSFVF